MSVDPNEKAIVPEDASGYVPNIQLEDDEPLDGPAMQPEVTAPVTPVEEPTEQAPVPCPSEPEPSPVPEAPEPTPEEEPEHAAPAPEDVDPPPPAEPPRQEPDANEPEKPHRKLFIALTCVFAVLALCAIAGISYVYLVIKPYESYDKIMPNVYCAGINLGGMTQSEAQAAIEEALRSPSNSVTVKLPDGSYEFCPAQEGVTLNGEAVARRAYSYMRTDTTAFGMYKAYRQAKATEYHLTAETELKYSSEDIAKQAETISKETRIEPTESTASYDEENHTVTLTLGEPGREILPESIENAVEQAFTTLDFSDISLDYDKIEIDTKALARLTRQCVRDYGVDVVEPYVYADADSHTIDVYMGTPGYTMKAEDLYKKAEEAMASGTYGSVTLELTEVIPTDVDITDAYHELACDPTEPYYANGDVQEGYDGYTLDWESAVNQIVNAKWGELVSVPMTAVPPEKTADEIRAVLFRDQLSTFSSPHTANAGRTANLTLACNAINGTVINAGETFSFNGVVGERTAAKGYQKATVYVGTDSKEETGGGICQVASTVYDAALYADLEITERAPHTFFVTYVNGGLDATVYWGSQDFCFRNNTEYPIRVDAWVSGGYVNISIYGTKINDNYVVLDYTKLSTTPYSTVTEYSSSLPSGTSKETTYPYTGYTYEAYQYVYSGDGTLLETNYLGKSTYKKRDRVITVGTG